MDNQEEAADITAETEPCIMAERVWPDEPINWVERLLSPRSLSWMMTVGGGLLVIGFAIWLWSTGLFENPVALAFAVGFVNLSLLGFGIGVLQKSRYQLAGSGLTLLSCLALPLNLWLYHAQRLITIEDHLWLPALIIAALYAAIASITKDARFVFTLVGGVVLTGVLFLAGAGNPVLWTSMSISTLLIGVGAACVQADRLFMDSNGPFSRERFGTAFFQSGQVALAAGLGFLFSSQWVSTLLSVSATNIWILTLLSVAILTYLSTETTSRKHVAYNGLAGLCCVWSGIVLLHWLNIQISFPLGLLFLNLVFVVLNILRVCYSESNPWEQATALGIAMITIFDGLFRLCITQTEFFYDWVVVLELLASATSILTVPKIFTNTSNPNFRLVALAGIFGLACSWLSAATQILPTGFELGVISLAVLCPLLASGIGIFPRRTKQISAFSDGMAISVILALAYGCFVIEVLEFEFVSCTAAIAMAGIASVLSGYFSGTITSIALAVFCGVIGFLQLAVRFQIVNGFAINGTITATGLLLLAVVAVKSAALKSPLSSSELRLKGIANGLVVTGAAGAFLFVLFKLIAGNVSYYHVGLLAYQMAAIAAAAAGTKQMVWRHSFMVTAALTLGLGITVHVNLSPLTLAQRIQLISILLGTFMVVAGHYGWLREGDRKSDGVTFNLNVGSLLLAIPLIYGLIAGRLDANVVFDASRYLHEIGVLTLGLVLIGAGVSCRIRATTIAGSVLMLAFICSSVLLIRWPEQLQTMSAMMMIGGGLFFTTALVLSVFRDRLIAIPKKAKQAEGVFQVINWR